MLIVGVGVGIEGRVEKEEGRGGGMVRMRVIARGREEERIKQGRIGGHVPGRPT